MRKFAGMCERSSVYIPGIGNFGPGDLKVHEQGVDTIIKFATMQDIDLADWISCKSESGIDKETRDSESDSDLASLLNLQYLQSLYTVALI